MYVSLRCVDSLAWGLFRQRIWESFVRSEEGLAFECWESRKGDFVKSRLGICSSLRVVYS